MSILTEEIRDFLNALLPVLKGQARKVRLTTHNPSLVEHLENDGRSAPLFLDGVSLLIQADGHGHLDLEGCLSAAPKNQLVFNFRVDQTEVLNSIVEIEKYLK